MNDSKHNSNQDSPNLVQNIHLTADVPSIYAGRRLDQALALLFKEHSRSRLKEWIEKEQVRVNGLVKRPRDKVAENDHIEIDAQLEAVSDWEGEAIPLNIVYEDEHILIINKPAGLVVHPGAGNRVGTLLNALLHHVPGLNQIPRAGIVHRLDKDTTGLMVVAKTLVAQTGLVTQLQARTVKRIYEAVVWGVPTAGGTVDKPIARHAKDRTRMSVDGAGKSAVTHYRLIKKYKNHTHLRVQLETGRTHQIRVHMAYINHPLVGDKVYGGRLRQPPGATAEFKEFLQAFPRQALHARTLGFLHPINGEPVEWDSELPTDFKELLLVLQQNS